MAPQNYTRIQGKDMTTSFITLFLYLVLFTGSTYGDDASANIVDAGVDAVAAGEIIFQEKCSVCHKTTDQQLVGPGLKGVMERRDEKWVDKWLKDPKGLIKSGDKTAVKLKSGYFRIMPAIEEMQDPVKRKEVIEYLKTLK